MFRYLFKKLFLINNKIARYEKKYNIIGFICIFHIGLYDKNIAIHGFSKIYRIIGKDGTYIYI